MGCECTSWICRQPHGVVCRLLVSKEHESVTVIGVGCNDGPHLHELKRHMVKHGIRVHIIEIDEQQTDVEVDEFIHSDVRNVVKHQNEADVVFCYRMLEYYSECTEDLLNLFRACINFLKEDGTLVVGGAKSLIGKRYQHTEQFILRIMTKADALDHTKTCVFPGNNLWDCSHGTMLMYDTSYITKWIPLR